MDAIQLVHSTGNERIDECLSAVITIIEALFPQRIRAYYVLGSYADRNAVPGSDVDLFVVSKDVFRGEEQDVYRRIAEQCAILAGLRRVRRPRRMYSLLRRPRTSTHLPVPDG